MAGMCCCCKPRASRFNIRITMIQFSKSWWCIVLIGLLGVLLIGIGYWNVNFHDGYYKCECTGTEFIADPTKCGETSGNVLDTIFSWIGQTTAGPDQQQQGDASSPNQATPNGCFVPLMTCTLDCGKLKPEYKINEANYTCRHVPVENEDSVSGACAEAFNHGVTYWFNPCAWNEGLWNTTSHGPQKYLYDADFVMCDDAKDMRPALDEEIQQYKWESMIGVGSFIVTLVLVYLLTKFMIGCVRCCRRAEEGYNAENFEDSPKSSKKRGGGGGGGGDNIHLSSSEEEEIPLAEIEDMHEHLAKAKIQPISYEVLETDSFV